MRVAFDSRPSSDPRGVGRYARCLLRALRDTGGERGEIVETHRPQRADVFHAPWMQGAMLRSPCPMVVTLHDLAPLKRRSEQLRGMRSRLRHLAVQRAASVIVPTETVAHDAVVRLGVARERLKVIAEAPDPAMYPRTDAEVAHVRERYELPERYLAWVGCLRRPNPRKHVAQLASTPRELPLVLVGPTGRWARELLGDAILTGHVPDDHLAAIYTGAQALVLPSQDEGFGLPAVEALACGTPVVASEIPALREVLDGRATFVEPGDLRALIEAAETVQRSASPTPPPWTWEDASRATWGVYEQALACA